MDEDHPGEDEEVDEPYDVERVLEVKDNQEVSVLWETFCGFAFETLRRKD